MPSPLPGMDPYIEHPEIWSDFHGDLAGDEGRYRVQASVGVVGEEVGLILLRNFANPHAFEEVGPVSYRFFTDAIEILPETSRNFIVEDF